MTSAGLTPLRVVVQHLWISAPLPVPSLGIDTDFSRTRIIAPSERPLITGNGG